MLSAISCPPALCQFELTNLLFYVIKQNRFCHVLLCVLFIYRNGYRCRKWTRRHEFKSCTKLIAFHIALIPWGKVWIQLFSLQLWVNSWTDWVLHPWWGTSLGEGNSELKPVKLRLKIDLVSYPALAEGLVNRIIYLLWQVTLQATMCKQFYRFSNYEI